MHASARVTVPWRLSHSRQNDSVFTARELGIAPTTPLDLAISTVSHLAHTSSTGFISSSSCWRLAFAFCINLSCINFPDRAGAPDGAPDGAASGILLPSCFLVSHATVRQTVAMRVRQLAAALVKISLLVEDFACSGACGVLHFESCERHGCFISAPSWTRSTLQMTIS